MKLYIPSSYSEWLSTNPKEGQVLLIGLLTKFAAIYGPDHYFEMYTDDIDTVNYNAPQGKAFQETKKLKELGLIETIRGVDGKVTLRCSAELMGDVRRRSIYTECIEYQLSQEAALLWSYLLGRLANVDATQEITEIAIIRPANTKRVDRSSKISVTHILAPIYNDIFTKRHISCSRIDKPEVGETQVKPKSKKQQQARDWYEKNKMETLRKKKEWYYNTVKKPKEDDGRI
jgi:hypothetical protein